MATDSLFSVCVNVSHMKSQISVSLVDVHNGSHIYDLLLLFYFVWYPEP
jgi:hypothetical protein